MVNWHRFAPADFEYDFERDQLVVHHVTFEEAVECFFSDFEVRRNQSYRDRYQLIGRTIGGRRRKMIFQLKPVEKEVEKPLHGGIHTAVLKVHAEEWELNNFLIVSF